MARGINKIETVMRAIRVPTLLLYPRIRREVKESLDESQQMDVLETNVKLTPKMEKMQTLLIKILKSTLDELKSQLKQYGVIVSFKK